ncbi:MAG: hypothetical protein ACAH95_03780 [Fimbriimonas sp.]
MTAIFKTLAALLLNAVLLAAYVLLLIGGILLISSDRIFLGALCLLAVLGWTIFAMRDLKSDSFGI